MGTELALAIANVVEKVVERDRARAGCDHSWGYHGHRFEEAVRKAGKELEDTINAMIDKRVMDRFTPDDTSMDDTDM